MAKVWMEETECEFEGVERGLADTYPILLNIGGHVVAMTIDEAVECADGLITALGTMAAKGQPVYRRADGRLCAFVSWLTLEHPDTGDWVEGVEFRALDAAPDDAHFVVTRGRWEAEFEPVPAEEATAPADADPFVATAKRLTEMGGL